MSNRELPMLSCCLGRGHRKIGQTEKNAPELNDRDHIGPQISSRRS
jgi:hypothetical protein